MENTCRGLPVPTRYPPWYLGNGIRRGQALRGPWRTQRVRGLEGPTTSQLTNLGMAATRAQMQRMVIPRFVGCCSHPVNAHMWPWEEITPHVSGGKAPSEAAHQGNHEERVPAPVNSGRPPQRHTIIAGMQLLPAHT